jgi:predicted enzyme related to lactoylglutathione lyase
MHVELHVDDFDKVKDFYSRLGFVIAREDLDTGAGGYLVLEREGAVISFWPGSEKVYGQKHFSQFPKDTPRGYGVEVVYMVDDIDTYYEEVKKHVDIAEPLRMRPWGLKDFRFTDPFGFYIRVTTPYDPRTYVPTAVEES